MTYKILVSDNNSYFVRPTTPPTFRAQLSDQTAYSVKVSEQPKYKTQLSYRIEILPVNLADLNDVEITGTPDKYVLMYDDNLKKWVNKNPDAVLSAAATEPIQPGLPADFINQLDIDLDNRIDVDAGEF